MNVITDIVKSLVDKQVVIATMDGPVRIVIHLMDQHQATQRQATQQQSNQQPSHLLQQTPSKRVISLTTHVMEPIVITAIVL
jgi:hypothetical protein